MTEPVPYWRKHNGNMDDALSAVLKQETEVEALASMLEARAEAEQNDYSDLGVGYVPGVERRHAILVFATSFDNELGAEAALLGAIARWTGENPERYLTGIEFNYDDGSDENVIMATVRVSAM